MGIIYSSLPLWLREPFAVAKSSVGEAALTSERPLSRQNRFSHFFGASCLSKAAQAIHSS